jgi:hypothetical protein
MILRNILNCSSNIIINVNLNERMLFFVLYKLVQNIL